MVAAAAAAAVLVVIVESSTARGERRRGTARRGNEGGAVEGPLSDGGDDDEEVGSSHVDRNGPTKFYPTIREARRGSGPRPTAATARSARAASLELRLASELRVRKRWSRGARRGEEAWYTTVHGVSDDRARTGKPLSLPRAPPSAKGVGATFSALSGRLAECAPVEEGAAAQKCVAVPVFLAE